MQIHHVMNNILKKWFCFVEFIHFLSLSSFKWTYKNAKFVFLSTFTTEQIYRNLQTLKSLQPKLPIRHRKFSAHTDNKKNHPHTASSIKRSKNKKVDEKFSLQQHPTNPVELERKREHRTTSWLCVCVCVSITSKHLHCKAIKQFYVQTSHKSSGSRSTPVNSSPGGVWK